MASANFEGATARWLESVQRRMPNSSCTEFCNALQSRFGRNQHQTLLRKLSRITPDNTVEDYVERFAELYDQLTAYEDAPNSLRYTTRFLAGLKPGVRIAGALRKPKDLVAAYELALLHEELGETFSNSSGSVSRRSTTLPSYGNSKGRPPEEKKDTVKNIPTDDKCLALRNYRKSKGLCFVYGEKWAKDHVCKPTVQLHFVQEMIEQMQSSYS